MASPRPDWASLPIEVWLKVLLLCRDHEGSQRQHWVRWWKILASVSTSCKALHSAVVGPAAEELWHGTFLTSWHPGLSTGQSRQLNRMLISQGRLARTAVVLGGGWDLDVLRTAAASLTGAHSLTLHQVAGAGETECWCDAFFTSAVRHLHYSGSHQLIFPTSLHSLELNGRMPVRSLLAQLRADPAYNAIVALSNLRSLKIFLSEKLSCDGGLQEGDVTLLAARLPQLQELHITTSQSPQPADLTAWAAFSRLHSRVQLSLDVSISGTLTPCLQSLRNVRLISLQLDCRDSDSSTLSAVDEACLAKCSVSQRLAVRQLRASQTFCHACSLRFLVCMWCCCLCNLWRAD